MRVTTLDPRYAPTSKTITAEGCLDGIGRNRYISVELAMIRSAYDSDLRNPSRFFMVFETGDNSTVQVGEAEPEDLFYSRAENFGDDYVVWTETDTGYDADPDTSVCYPDGRLRRREGSWNRLSRGSGFCNEFNRMNARVAIPIPVKPISKPTRTAPSSTASGDSGCLMTYGEDVIDSEANVRTQDGGLMTTAQSDAANNAWTLPGHQSALAPGNSWRVNA